MARGTGTGRWRGRLLALVAGLAASLVLLEVALRVVGLGILLVQEHRNPLPEDAADRYRVLCIGESTTAGHYPTLLQDELNRRAEGEVAWVINRGQPGADTSVILAGLEEDLDRYRPHAVVAMMGANDYGGAIPQAEVPVAERRGLVEHVKVLKLGWYLSYTIAREGRRTREVEATRPGGFDLADREVEVPPLVEGALALERLGQPGEARALFEEALASGETPVAALVAWGRFLERQGAVADGEAAIREALERDPGSTYAWLQLADLLKHDDRAEPAMEALEQAARADPSDPVPPLWLGKLLGEAGRTEEAVEAYSRAVALDPRTVRAYTSLVPLLRELGRDHEAEAVLRRAVAANPDSDVVLGLAAHQAYRAGRRAEAEELFRRANDLRMQHFTTMTVDNYRRAHDLVHARGALLVALPYPFRSTEPLRWILEGRQGVLYVDHEEMFHAALAQSGYDALFIDHCNGDSGHGTRLGDGILARSVAAVLRVQGGAPGGR